MVPRSLRHLLLSGESLLPVTVINNGQLVPVLHLTPQSKIDNALISIDEPEFVVPRSTPRRDRDGVTSRFGQPDGQQAVRADAIVIITSQLNAVWVVESYHRIANGGTDTKQYGLSFRTRERPIVNTVGIERASIASANVQGF